MDLAEYVQERVKNPRRKAIIMADVNRSMTNYPNSAEVDFVNNFYCLLPNFSTRNSILARTEDNPERRFIEMEGYRYASRKLKLQTPKQFFETIDETIKQLGISVEDLTISILRDRGRELAESYQTLFKIMVDLIAKGYKRYPDLSR